MIWKLILVAWLQGTNMAPTGYELGNFDSKESCEEKLEVVKKLYIEQSKKETMPPIALSCEHYGEF